MEISWNKAQELANAIGEGAELKVFENGEVAIYLHRIAPESESKFDMRMPVSTIYNKRTVTFEEAAQLFKERHSFTIHGGKLKAEWAEFDNVYVIASFGYIIYEYYPDSVNEKLMGPDEFRASKPNATQYRHYNWVHAQLYAMHNNGAEMPEEMLLKGVHNKAERKLKSVSSPDDFKL